MAMWHGRVVVCGCLVLVISSTGRCVVSIPPQTPTPALPHLSSPEGIAKCWGKALSGLHNDSFNLSLPATCPVACSDLQVEVVSEEWARATGDRGALHCLRQLHGTRGRLVQDVYWFVSRTTDTMIYLGNSSEVVLTWDYLTEAQKVWEVMLLVVVVAGLTAALLGNTLVLATMLASDHSDALWVMRASLAASDLLRGVTVVVLAVHDTFSLMTHPSDLNVTPSTLPHVRGGVATFVGVTFWITTLVSVQCLAWLSVERMLLCGFPHVCRHLTVRRATGASVVVWLLAAGLPITLVLLARGPITYFDPATKFTFLLPDGDTEGVARVLLVIQYGYLVVLSLLTAAASMLALWGFRVRVRQEDKDAERHTPAACVWRKRRDDQTIHSTLLLMLTTFLLSVPPYLLLFLLQYLLPTPIRNSHIQPVHCTVSWLFVLTSSWQWYVYNLRSDFFRKHVVRLFLGSVCLPRRLKERLRGPTPSDHALSLEWAHAWFDMHTFIRRKSMVVAQGSEGVGEERRRMEEEEV